VPTDAMGLLGLLDAPSHNSAVNKPHTRADLDLLFDTPSTQTPPLKPDSSLLTPTSATGSISNVHHVMQTDNSTSAFSSLLSPSSDPAAEHGTIVASSNDIQVSMSKVLVNTDLVISATISNLGSVLVRTLTVSFDASSMPAFKVTVSSSSNSASVSGFRVTFPFLQAQSHVCVSAVLALSSPTLVLPLSSVRCQFQFTVGDPGRLVPLHHSLPLSISDFVRPAHITEQEFGMLWPKHSQERKFSISSPSLTDPPSLIARITDTTHLAHVKTIRTEVIFCGTDVANKHCLIHSRIVSPGRVDVTVRTMDVKYSDAVQRVCVAGLNAANVL